MPGFEQSNSDNDNEPGLVWVVFMRDDDEFEIGPLYALVWMTIVAKLHDGTRVFRWYRRYIDSGNHLGLHSMSMEMLLILPEGTNDNFDVDDISDMFDRLLWK